MRQDAWRAYLEMALGVTEASTKKALKTAKRVVGKSGVSADQLQGLADELVRASAANREAVRNLVRVELERALNAVGLAKADEVETLTARVRELESQLQASKPVVADDGGPVPSSLAAPVAKKAVAKKAVAKKAGPAAGSVSAVDAAGEAEIAATTEAARAARAAVAAESPAEAEVPASAAASGAAAPVAPAKKAVAKKAVAKKAAPAKTAPEAAVSVAAPAKAASKDAAPAKVASKDTASGETAAAEKAPAKKAPAKTAAKAPAKTPAVAKKTAKRA